MDYSPWDHKELDTTERLSLQRFYTSSVPFTTILVGAVVILLLLIMKQSNDTLEKQFYKNFFKKSGFLGFVKFHRVNSPTVPGLPYQVETASS